MASKHPPAVSPAPRDVALTLPLLGNHVTRTTIVGWFKRPWLDGFVEGEPLVRLGTGEIVRSPCAGYLRWTLPNGMQVRVGQRLAIIRRTPEAKSERIPLGINLDSKKPVAVTTKHLASGCYILGVQGMGKSSLLEELARQMLTLDESVIVFDPHGGLIDSIVSRMPE